MNSASEEIRQARLALQSLRDHLSEARMALADAGELPQYEYDLNAARNTAKWLCADLWRIANRLPLGESAQSERERV